MDNAIKTFTFQIMVDSLLILPVISQFRCKVDEVRCNFDGLRFNLDGLRCNFDELICNLVLNLMNLDKGYIKVYSI